MWTFRAFELKNNDLNHFHRYQCVFNFFFLHVYFKLLSLDLNVKKEILYVFQFIYQIRVEVHSTSTSYMSGKR